MALEIRSLTLKNSSNWQNNVFFFQHYFQSGPSANRQTGAGASQLTIQWTNQHGCGGNEDTDPQKQNCNMVLQFMCEDAIENLPGMQQKSGQTGSDIIICTW